MPVTVLHHAVMEIMFPREDFQKIKDAKDKCLELVFSCWEYKPSINVELCEGETVVSVRIVENLNRENITEACDLIEAFFFGVCLRPGGGFTC